MIDVVLAETNWILDVILERDPASSELLEHAEARTVRVILPSFCLAEATKVLEAMQSAWRLLRERLTLTASDLEGSALLRSTAPGIRQAITSLAQAHDLLDASFWDRLKKIAAAVTILPPTPDVIGLTAEIRDSLKLSHADSSVLATAVSCSRDASCKTFMSRDRAAFATAATKTYMHQEGVHYVDAAEPIVGPRRGHKT